MDKKLTVARQRKLRREFPNGEAIGRAFVQFYLDRKRKMRETNFKPTLTTNEMNFLIKTIYTSEDEELAKPYYTLEKILHQFAYWLDHYEHVYYHGLFRDLSVIQTPDYDIQIYHFIKSQTPADEEAIEKARLRYNKSLVPIVDILIPNWNNLIASPLKELYRYSFRLEKIQELTNFDFSPIIPDMKHHEGEVKELQRLATIFRFNLKNYVSNFNFEVNSDVINNLDKFIRIDINTLKLNDDEKEDNIKRAIETVEIMKGATYD